LNISLITSAHSPYDDRIFFHMAQSLVINNYNITIITSRCKIEDKKDDILLRGFEGNELKIREKIVQFISLLSQAKPDIIICSEPITVLASRRYAKEIPHKIRIIYDVTEWNPSIRMIYYSKFPLNWVKYFQKLVFNYYASYFVDSYIFGEWYKSRPYRFLHPGKPFVFISYYPNLKYIPISRPSLQKNILRLSYSGRISLEKGYLNFIKVINELQKQKEQLQIHVKIIGWYETDKDRMDCENFMTSIDKRISVNFYEKLQFVEYLNLIADTDIFLDLRNINKEIAHSLPIKLFYYAAVGRPMIFSKLKSIVRALPIDQFGYLVNPKNINLIVNLITTYLDNPALYYEHCEKARKVAEEKYNWKTIEPDFLSFIHTNAS
jgi:glycosyltransferase involved in cell wall biosynthesis